MADEKYGIATGYNSQLIQDYLKYSDKSIGAQRQARQGVVDTSTSMMYDALGRMQLQTERDIAKRRIQAQRSGMTSSGLASLEMQNIMVGQMGAQQLAQQYRMETAGIESEFAGAEDAARAGLFETLNANRGQVAAVDAQRFSASSIEQMRELYPDATPAQLDALGRRLLGGELDSSDKKVIGNLTTDVKSAMSDIGVVNEEAFKLMLETEEPVDFKTFANLALGKSRSGSYKDYEKYIETYNKYKGTNFKSSDARLEARMTTNSAKSIYSNRASNLEELKELIKSTE